MEKKPAPAAETEDRVTLKPLMGIRPGVYLAAIYAAALLVIIFVVLFVPGLWNPGSVLVVKTEPLGAALRVDGVYRGTSPDRIFVSKGRHTLEMVLPGFSSETVECDIPGRLFASALFPRLYPLERSLAPLAETGGFVEAAGDYAAWTFGGEPTVSWQVPLSLSEGAYRFGPALAAGSGGPAAEEVLRAAARFAVTRAALRDLIRAQFLLANGGLSPSPLSLVRSGADITAFLSANPSAAAWLADTLPPESAALVISSAWYQNQLAAFAAITAAERLSPAPDRQRTNPQAPTATGNVLPNQVRLNGLLFTIVGGGTLAQGEPFPHTVEIAPFMACNTQIPPPAYADFLDANPLWKKEQTGTLVEEGLVTGSYLSGDGDGFAAAQRRFSGGGINSVSWFAAQAFCTWLSGKLPSMLADYEVRLPTEAEWEYAAKSAAGWEQSSSIYQIDFSRDDFWEWCGDFFAPLNSVTASPQAARAVGSPERSLRGGSWLNQIGSVLPETRASLPPEFCSPFVSFRPVIARKAPPGAPDGGAAE